MAFEKEKDIVLKLLYDYYSDLESSQGLKGAVKRLKKGKTKEEIMVETSIGNDVLMPVIEKLLEEYIDFEDQGARSKMHVDRYVITTSGIEFIKDGGSFVDKKHDLDLDQKIDRRLKTSSIGNNTWSIIIGVVTIATSLIINIPAIVKKGDIDNVIIRLDKRIDERMDSLKKEVIDSLNHVLSKTE